MDIANYTIDICRFLTGRQKSLFIDMMIPDLRKYTNVMLPCPRTVSRRAAFNYGEIALQYNLLKYIN